MDDFQPSYHQSNGGGGRKVEFHGHHAAGVDQMYVARSRSHNPPSTFRKRKIPSSTPSLMSSVRSWFEDPELKRKKRVANYKRYSIEGKVKSSFKKGYRWIKKKCHYIVHGY
ncbi:hypothetical protein Ancab_000666 [Ancistrocladus abbreviatus]